VFDPTSLFTAEQSQPNPGVAQRLPRQHPQAHLQGSRSRWKLPGDAVPEQPAHLRTPNIAAFSKETDVLPHPEGPAELCPTPERLRRPELRLHVRAQRPRPTDAVELRRFSRTEQRAHMGMEPQHEHVPQGAILLGIQLDRVQETQLGGIGTDPLPCLAQRYSKGIAGVPCGWSRSMEALVSSSTAELAA
jgi:hypothetical protein